MSSNLGICQKDFRGLPKRDLYLNDRRPLDLISGELLGHDRIFTNENLRETTTKPFFFQLN